MIKTIGYIYLFCFALSANSQVSMKEKLESEFHEQVKEFNIKSITEWTFCLDPSTISDLEYVMNSITYRANFDSIGNCTYKVWFHDSTSKSQNFYWYDDEARLTRSVEGYFDTLNMTHIFENKYNRSGYLTQINKFRRNDSKDSLIDRIEISYNARNQLVNKKMYYSSSDYCYYMDSIVYNNKGNISKIMKFKNATKNNEATYHTETEFYYYDKKGNLVSKISIDERDQSIDNTNEYINDKKGRVIDSKYFQSEHLIHHFTYTYNDFGALNFTSINQNSFKYVYDENGLKKQVIRYNWKDQPSIVTVYDYEFY
ncbi:MAG: hypothetical protein RIQ76_1037 [Pseudomonadota bacterium]